MPNTFWQDLASIRLIPMYEVQFIMANGDNHWFRYPEKDSAWSLRAIRQRRRLVGSRFEITAHFPYTALSDMEYPLRHLQSDDVANVILYLRALDGQQLGARMEITEPSDIPAAPDLSRWDVSWEITKAELRPRLTITAQGTFSKEAFPAITQTSGWV